MGDKVFLRLPRVLWQIIFNYLPTKSAKRVCIVCKFFNVNFWEHRNVVKIKIDRNRANIPPPYQFRKVRELIILRKPGVGNIKFYKWIEQWPVYNNIRSLLINQIGPGDSNVIIKKVPRLQKLSLDITNLANYSRRYDWNFLTEEFMLQLTDFTLKGMHTIQRREKLQQLNKGLRNCETLELSGVPLFQEGNRILFKGLINVRSLTLTGQNINNNTFKIIVDEMPELRELIIPRRKNKQLTAGALTYISELNNLRYINIAGYSDCTDLITDDIFLSNPRLQKVHMNGCGSITDLTLHSLARNLPDIKEISFRDCYLLTDEIFISLAPLPLRVMNFSICLNISNRGIEQFCRAWLHGNYHLRVADFSNTPKVTSAGEQMLKAVCVNLLSFKTLCNCRHLK